MSKHKYSFGCLEWQGETYRKDLLILPGGEVLCPWRREHGHHLEPGDLLAVIQAHPQVLIIGTGASGLMKVDEEVLTALAEQGLDAEVMPTGKAVKRFADVRKEKRAAAALHLTC